MRKATVLKVKKGDEITNVQVAVLKLRLERRDGRRRRHAGGGRV